MANERTANPLDSFQSHSIHYVILAARSTEAIRNFTGDGDTSALQGIDNCKNLGDEIQGSADKCYLVADTRRFSQFGISNFELHCTVAGFSIPGSKTPNTVGQDLGFTVTDSSGISFANFMQYLCDEKLQVSTSALIFLIKIIFTGHEPDGSTKVIQSTGIPVMLKSMSLSLTDISGVYACKCIPLIGCISNSKTNAQFTTIGSSSNYFSGNGADTLGAIIKSFEKRINEESLNRYKEQNSILQTAGEEQQKEGTRLGRPVQFMITIPPAWESFTFNGPAAGNAVEIDFNKLIKDQEQNKQKKAQSSSKNVPAIPTDLHVSVLPTMTVPEILDIIFSQTLQVQELANFKKTPGESLKFYKHVLTITSDDLSYTVHIDVAEFVVPNAPQVIKSNALPNPSNLFDQKDGKNVPKNYLEYDYIFTGLNTDVLSLDLKIENLNFILMQGSKIGQGALFSKANDAQKQKDGTVLTNDTGTAVGRHSKDPVFLRTLTRNEKTNFSNLGSTKKDSTGSAQSISQQYTRNIADLYSLANQAKMTIRGNPEYFTKIALSQIPKHTSALTLNDNSVSKVNDTVKSSWRTEFDEKILKLNNSLTGVLSGPSIASTPIFVKVNIKSSNVDFKTLEPIAGQDFTKEFLSDNYYWATVIRHKIDNSIFTQEFDLTSFFIYGDNTATERAQDENAVKEIQ